MSSPDKLKRKKGIFWALAAGGFGAIILSYVFDKIDPGRYPFNEITEVEIGLNFEPWTVGWEGETDAEVWELAFSKGAAPPEMWVTIARVDKPSVSCEVFDGCELEGFLHVRACRLGACSSSVSIRTPSRG